jgi:hypothetical protein
VLSRVGTQWVFYLSKVGYRGRCNVPVAGLFASGDVQANGLWAGIIKIRVLHCKEKILSLIHRPEKHPSQRTTLHNMPYYIKTQISPTHNTHHTTYITHHTTSRQAGRQTDRQTASVGKARQGNPSQSKTVPPPSHPPPLPPSLPHLDHLHLELQVRVRGHGGLHQGLGAVAELVSAANQESLASTAVA